MMKSSLKVPAQTQPSPLNFQETIAWTKFLIYRQTTSSLMRKRRSKILTTTSSANQTSPSEGQQQTITELLSAAIEVAPKILSPRTPFVPSRGPSTRESKFLN